MPSLSYLPLALFTATFCSLILLSQSQHVCVEIPDKFLGRFVVDHSDNLDAFLIARGYSWLKRKLAIATKPTQIFKKNTAKPCAYDLTYKSFLKTMQWNGFRLGVPFRGAYLDDKEYTVRYSYDKRRDRLVRSMALPGEPEVISEFFFTPDGFVVLTSEFKGIIARVYFRRTD